MEVKTAVPTLDAVKQPVTTGAVTSKDGTTIGYRRLGEGRALVILHGAASSGYNHLQLGEALADAFTVYLPDRRGRGLSGPYNGSYSIQTEVDDLAALLAETGAGRVFAVSAGAIITLQAAHTLPSIQQIALYEPPLFRDRSIPAAVLERFDREMAQGKVAAALITGMKGAQMGPAFFNAMPRWLTERMTGMMMSQEDKKGSGDYVPMRAIAPTLHYDFQLVADMSGPLETFAEVRADALLLGGSKSPAYLKEALDALEQTLPHAARLELPGLDHAAPWNADRGGQPASVATVLRRFFS